MPYERSLQRLVKRKNCFTEEHLNQVSMNKEKRKLQMERKHKFRGTKRHDVLDGHVRLEKGR